MAESSTKRSPQSNGQLLPNQKMRTTCNACQQAKIRCSHTYPCDRCEGHGYECVYSISQPLGRPAKRKTTRPAAAGAVVKARRGEVEVVDRPTQRSAGEGTEANPSSEGAEGAQGPESGPESNNSIGLGAGTEVTPPEEDSQWPSFTALFSEVPENNTNGEGVQDQDVVSANEAYTHHVDPGFADTILASSFGGTDGFGSFGGPRFPEPRVDYTTQCHAPQIASIHTSAPGTQAGSLFRGGAIYPFSLAPNAIQVSGTVQDPARIMELPSNEIWDEPMETDSSQSLEPREIDFETIPEDASSLHCNCYDQAFSEVVRPDEAKGSNSVLLHLERVQQQGVVILQCPACCASNARVNILTLLVMAIENAARALKMRRCLSHLSIIVRFINQDLQCASPSKWHLVMVDETDRRLQSIIRIFE
ncbi:hypothetical protein N7516_007877 [Penicillium verrucosum]|uniref:uncharacterized protein n=1 Tax=Penicillium verrucosum TaxID=60171 RepID=UPI0025451826|nr:uncharacterized protein N7516_007877 [Penicillium verrucosum]KAJ5926104.1 hypothetical protein N7516_007877 [Penicillium verrucosum]